MVENWRRCLDHMEHMQGVSVERWEAGVRAEDCRPRSLHGQGREGTSEPSLFLVYTTLTNHRTNTEGPGRNCKVMYTFRSVTHI